MKKLFDANLYDSSVVMHCDTESKAIYFLNYLNSIGKKWGSGVSYTVTTNYKKYGSYTCYNFNCGSFGPMSWYKMMEYRILEFDDFVFYKSNKSKFMDKYKPSSEDDE